MKEVWLDAASNRVFLEAEVLLREAGFRVLRDRRSRSRVVRLGRLVIDPSHHRVEWRGRAVDLTPVEFRLLRVLADQPGVLVAPEQLLEQAWGAEYREDGGYVKPIVSRLRHKLDDDPRKPQLIETVRGFGYRLRPDPR